MSTIFALLFLILMIVLVVGLLLLSTIFRFFSGLGRRKSSYKRSYKYEEEQHDSTTGYKQTTPSGTRKKVFDDDEGEYVEFEEVKD